MPWILHSGPRHALPAVNRCQERPRRAYTCAALLASIRPPGSDVESLHMADRCCAWEDINERMTPSWDAASGFSRDCRQRHAMPPHQLVGFSLVSQLGVFWKSQFAQQSTRDPVNAQNKANGEEEFRVRVLWLVECIGQPVIGGTYSMRSKPIGKVNWAHYERRKKGVEEGPGKQSPPLAPLPPLESPASDSYAGRRRAGDQE